ncbi:zinc ABC transporter ATP-binding protein ZnuC [Sessilibacter corallicola]|uniref:zinc ABC transporter ATP-binding protein ZnuC n=1 Tax=Sessilibacter corallicola TaxID=2904075 RepID=UPI003D9C7262
MELPLQPLLSANNVLFQRNGKAILDGVDIQIQRGEILTLIGPNGAGKTTLVRILLGLLSPDKGNIKRSKNLTIGYMPQKLSLDGSMPLTVDRFLALTGSKPAAIGEALARVDVPAIGRQLMSKLSGGELQRVMLARAIVRKPDLLVLDEPVQGVDITGQSKLYRLIGELRSELNCAVLMISHDLHLVMAQTDTVVCLNHHICCQGHPESISTDPAFLELFGQQTDTGVAVYTHHHDHQHDSGETRHPHQH